MVLCPTYQSELNFERTVFFSIMRKIQSMALSCCFLICLGVLKLWHTQCEFFFWVNWFCLESIDLYDRNKKARTNYKHISCCYIQLLFWHVIFWAVMRRGWSEVGKHKLNSSIWKSQNKASFSDKCNINIFVKRILYVHKIFSMSETQVWTDTSMCSFQGCVSFIAMQKLC